MYLSIKFIYRPPHCYNDSLAAVVTGGPKNEGLEQQAA